MYYHIAQNSMGKILFDKMHLFTDFVVENTRYKSSSLNVASPKEPIDVSIWVLCSNYSKWCILGQHSSLVMLTSILCLAYVITPAMASLASSQASHTNGKLCLTATQILLQHCSTAYALISCHIGVNMYTVHR